MCEYRSSTVADPVDRRVQERVRALREHRFPTLAVAGRRFVGARRTGRCGCARLRRRRRSTPARWRRSRRGVAARSGSAPLIAASRMTGASVGAALTASPTGATTRPALAASVRSPSTCDRGAVDHHVLHPDGLVGGEPLGVGREVAHPRHRSRRDRRRVEDRDVGPRARAQVAAVGEPEDVGLLAAQLAHGLLDRHHAAVAHPVAEEVGGLGRVAELAGMGAGVGEPERAVLVDEQIGDAVLVVVGDDRAHPQREPGLVEREVEQAVERLDAALGGEVGELAVDAGRGVLRSDRRCRCPTGDRSCWSPPSSVFICARHAGSA